MKGKSSQRCPEETRLTRSDGTLGNRTIFTVSSWLSHPDSWWTEDKLPDPASMAQKVYRIAASKFNDCGV